VFVFGNKYQGKRFKFDNCGVNIWFVEWRRCLFVIAIHHSSFAEEIYYLWQNRNTSTNYEDL